jgi:hypothetical protein
MMSAIAPLPEVDLQSSAPRGAVPDGIAEHRTAPFLHKTALEAA